MFGKRRDEQTIARGMLGWSALAQFGCGAFLLWRFSEVIGPLANCLAALLAAVTTLMWLGFRPAWLMSRLTWALLSALLIYAGLAVAAVQLWAGADASIVVSNAADALIWLAPPLILYLVLSSRALRRHFARDGDAAEPSG